MSLPLNALATLFVTHWVGDYLLQGNTMAARKAFSLQWLSLHVLTYTIILFVGSLFFFSLSNAISFALLNGALHWITDFLTGRISSRYKGTPRVYYPIIGFDQLVHTLTLLFTSTLYPR